MEQDLKAKIHAHDRLLKALITLLAIRDPELLAELDEIFSAEARNQSDPGASDTAVWQHLRSDLSMIRSLSIEDDACNGHGQH